MAVLTPFFKLRPVGRRVPSFLVTFGEPSWHTVGLRGLTLHNLLPPDVEKDTVVNARDNINNNNMVLMWSRVSRLCVDDTKRKFERRRERETEAKAETKAKTTGKRKDPKARAVDGDGEPSRFLLCSKKNNGQGTMN